MCRIIAVTPHHHHTVLAHGATIIHSVPTIICSAMVVSCGRGIMLMIHHVMVVHLQHSQVHLYLLTSQYIRYVDTLLISITVTLNFTLEQAKGGADV